MEEPCEELGAGHIKSFLFCPEIVLIAVGNECRRNEEDALYITSLRLGEASFYCEIIKHANSQQIHECC